MIRFSVVFISFTCLLCSCKDTRKIQSAIVKKDSVTIVIPPVYNGREDSLAFIRESYNHILNHKIDFTTFSAKMDVDYDDPDGKKMDVNAQIRMYKDSIIWVSITAILGIEGLRAYITPDSVKLLDKQNKIYIARSVAYLQEITALPLDLPSLQDLLIGNPVFLDSNITSYSKSTGSVSLLGINEIFKMLITISDPEKLLQSSKLDDLDEQRNRTSYLTYSDYETKKGVAFSKKRTITVSEKKKLGIKLNFKQYEFNETLSFPFNVPKNYKSE